MRTASWILSSALVFGLAACGDDGTTDTGATETTTNMTAGSSTTGDMTTAPMTTTGMTTGSTDPTTGTMTNPTTGDMTTGDMTTGGTTGGAEPTCGAYCATYMSACADFKEYDNMQACLDQCGQWPVGEANATGGDSLGCRLYHVTVASMADANVHCPHAGPSGAGVCVDPNAPTCASYCGTYLGNCKGDLNAYADEADCLDQCSHWYPGTKDMTDGDTIGCREYHAGVALGMPDVHCPHAGPGGGGVCVVP